MKLKAKILRWLINDNSVLENFISEDIRDRVRNGRDIPDMVRDRVDKLIDIRDYNDTSVGRTLRSLVDHQITTGLDRLKVIDKQAIDTYVNSEEFLDKIIVRIKAKQLC